MIFVELLFALVLLSVTIVSCTKKGCTDCNAINYSKEAEKDDSSCEYVNGELLGTYAVQDSIAAPPTLEWNHGSYDLEVYRSVCAPERLTISNYANKNINSNATDFTVDCQIDNNMITITEQEMNGCIVRGSTGYFSNDSIYFDIEYENEFGEVIYGKCFGHRKF